MNENIYDNLITGATPNPLISNPSEVDEDFAQEANRILKLAAETARALIGVHQSAIAVIVEGDWTTVRKYFSLSQKYVEWADYDVPAKGIGTHDWFLHHNQPIRMTQAELEAHHEWRNFDTQSELHPPMRGWLAVPLIDRQGKNWGLFQLSDKYEGEFTEEDETQFIRLGELVSSHLETLWRLRNLRKQNEQEASS